MNEGELRICANAGDLYRAAAEEFATLAERAVAVAGRFTVALSGGSTPRGLYSLLAAARYRERIPWTKLHFFWGDERCVPPDHPESNFRMARESLLAKVPLPSENIHRIAGEKEPRLAASEYERALRDFFALPRNGMPRFDLVLLGLGEDGHTASLFPGSAALEESERLAAAIYVEKFQSHRVTLTPPVLNAAAVLIFLVAGRNKAAILRDLLERRSETLPAGKIKPRHGALRWLVDEEAAALLREAPEAARRRSAR